jgi:hypothetical protein
VKSESGKERAQRAPLSEAFRLRERGPGGLRVLIVTMIGGGIESVKKGKEMGKV